MKKRDKNKIEAMGPCYGQSCSSGRASPSTIRPALSVRFVSTLVPPCISRRNPPFFAHPFFLFFGPVHPTLPKAIFFPKLPTFWDLKSTLSCRLNVEKRQPAGGWFFGKVLDMVAPQEKKENPFFLARVGRPRCIP